MRLTRRLLVAETLVLLANSVSAVPLWQSVDSDFSLSFAAPATNPTTFTLTATNTSANSYPNVHFIVPFAYEVDTLPPTAATAYSWNNITRKWESGGSTMSMYGVSGQTGLVLMSASDLPLSDTLLTETPTVLSTDAVPIFEVADFGPGAVHVFTIDVAFAPGFIKSLFTGYFVTADSQWGIDGGGSWNTSANWIGPAPAAATDSANFRGALATGGNAPAMVSLDGSKTVGSVNFDNTTGGALTSYEIVAGSGGSLSVGDVAQSGSITVLSGAHRISVPVSFGNAASTIDVATGAELTISGRLSVVAGGLATKLANGVLSDGTLNLTDGLNLGAASSLKLESGTTNLSGASIIGASSTINVLAGAALNVSGATDPLFGANGVVLANDGMTTIAGGGAKSPASVSGVGDLAVSAGATVVTGPLAQSNLTVDGSLQLADLASGGQVAVLGISNGATTTTSGSLTLGAAGAIDIKDVGIIINYTGASPEAAIISALVAGRNVAPGGFLNGSWDGATGISSSTANAEFVLSSVEGLAIGFVDNGSFLYGATASVRGVAVGDHSIILSQTLPGDTNVDGTVNDTDLNTLLAYYGVAGSYNWYQGDSNGDSIVNDSDLNSLLAFYGTSMPWAGMPFAGENARAVAVPEPCVLILPAAGILVACGRRRRNRG